MKSVLPTLLSLFSQIYFYSRDYSEAVPGFGFLNDIWRDVALPYDEQARDTSFQRSQNKLAVQGPIKIASLPLKQYKAEDISLDVDGENIILHGQHRSASIRPFPIALVKS